MVKKYAGACRRKRRAVFVLSLFCMLALGLVFTGERTGIEAEKVYDEDELIATIENAEPGTQLIIELKNDITLSLTSLNTLEIPAGISIILIGKHTLTGITGYPTITVNGTLKIYGITVTHEKGESGCGVQNSGTFVMASGAIVGNFTTNGAGVYNNAGASFTMEGGTISGNSACAGGGVYNDGTFNMFGGTISGNSSEDGGGIYNNGTFNMSNNAVVSCNGTTGYGGGLFNNGDAATKAAFNMTGGKIFGNSADITGGGVCNAYSSEFNMSGSASISNNTTVYGGGVSNWDESTFNMSGGTISDNSADFGGGVFNWKGSTFNMSDGTISYNYATQGGGVANWSTGYETAVTFAMTGGAITYNTAVYGGGMFNNFVTDNIIKVSSGTFSCNIADYGGGIYNAGTLIVTGGEFTSNVAKGTLARGSGGGIFTTDFACLTVGDGVVFSGNVAPTLRMKDIAENADIDGNKTFDLDDYKNIGDVKLDAYVCRGQNAPAYNNCDINYPGEYYTVFIAFESERSGTVTVTYGSRIGTVHKTMNLDGYVYVPTTVSMITLSAEPKAGYEFIMLSIDGKPAVRDDLTKTPILNDMTITAVFTAAPAPIKHHDHFITAVEDNGSTIIPNDTTKASHGGNKTFVFSAKPGYIITAVFVDGVAISSEELASGKYTFCNVECSHTICVISAAYSGNAGNGMGPGGNDGTEWGGNGPMMYV